MSKVKTQLKYSGHDAVLSQAFRNYLSNQRFCNVVLSAEGETVLCHQEILSASSQVFNKLFQNLDKNMQPIVFLKDVRMHDLRVLIDFVYHGEVSVPQDEFRSVIDTGQSLKIAGLCSSEICENLKNLKCLSTKQLKSSLESNKSDSGDPPSIEIQFAKKSSPKSIKENTSLSSRIPSSTVGQINLFLQRNVSVNSDVMKNSSEPYYATATGTARASVTAAASGTVTASGTATASIIATASSTATATTTAPISRNLHDRNVQRARQENAEKCNNFDISGNETSQPINAFSQNVSCSDLCSSSSTCPVSHITTSTLHIQHRKNFTSSATSFSSPAIPAPLPVSCHTTPSPSVSSCQTIPAPSIPHKTVDSSHPVHEKKYESKVDKDFDPLASRSGKEFETLQTTAVGKKYEALKPSEDNSYESLQANTEEKKYVTLKTRKEKEKDLEKLQQSVGENNYQTFEAKLEKNLENLQQDGGTSKSCGSVEPKPKKRKVYESAAPVYDNRQIFAADLLQTQLDYAGGEDVDDYDAFGHDSVMDLAPVSGTADCGPFRKLWSETYLCYNLGKEIICLICFCRFTQFKKYNLNRHMQRKHPAYYQLSLQSKKKCLDEFVRRYEEVVTPSVLTAVPGQGNQSMVQDILQLRNVDWSELLGEECALIMKKEGNRDEMDADNFDQRQEFQHEDHTMMNKILDC